MRDAGLLSSDLTAVHCNTVTDEELKMLVDAGASISVTPVVELLMGIGTPVGAKIRRLGARPALGTDVVVGTGTDLFRQMQAELGVERGLDNQRRLDAGEELSEVTPAAREVLLDATVGGAAALGLGDRIGTLTPGKQADIVLLDTSRLNLGPLSDPVGAVVTGADTANVDTVIVAGRVVKRGGKLVDVDHARLRELAASSQRHLLQGLTRSASHSSASDAVSGMDPV
jgi:cytosine/adenosine deaminase-related metal-dependent hydrolase